MMKKRVPDKFWFPWWPDKWIFGSIRIECTPAERGIWVDLLSLASKDDGYIQANAETPYPLAQLAGMLIIPEKELDAAINKFIKMRKLTKTKTGTLYVTEWEKYQFSERHKRRVEQEMAEKTAMEAKKSASILNKNTLNNNTLNNKKEGPQVNITAEQEMQIVKGLSTVKGMGNKKIGMVVCYLRELSIKFPDVDYVEEMEKKITWWVENPLTKKSNVLLQIRNWFNNVQKYIDEAKSQHRVGAPRGKYETKYPMLFLNNVYKLLRKQGKDNDKYSKLLFSLTDAEAKQAAIKYNDAPAEFIKFLEEGK